VHDTDGNLAGLQYAVSGDTITSLVDQPADMTYSEYTILGAKFRMLTGASNNTGGIVSWTQCETLWDPDAKNSAKGIVEEAARGNKRGRRGTVPMRGVITGTLDVGHLSGKMFALNVGGSTGNSTPSLVWAVAYASSLSPTIQLIVTVGLAGARIADKIPDTPSVVQEPQVNAADSLSWRALAEAYVRYGKDITVDAGTGYVSESVLAVYMHDDDEMLIVPGSAIKKVVLRAQPWSVPRRQQSAPGLLLSAPSRLCNVAVTPRNGPTTQKVAVHTQHVRWVDGDPDASVDACAYYARTAAASAATPLGDDVLLAAATADAAISVVAGRRENRRPVGEDSESDSD
jgi:hypothetical protein